MTSWKQYYDPIIEIINFYNIIDISFNTDTFIPHINSNIGIRIFWQVWKNCLIASLFFVGKRLQEEPKPNSTKAILVKKEPYLLIQDVSDALRQIRKHRSSKQLDSLIYTVKCLEEKLAVESGFGYGKSTVIDCENNIAKQIQFLLDTVRSAEQGDLDKNLKKITMVVMDINSLLRRRTELKKH